MAQRAPETKTNGSDDAQEAAEAAGLRYVSDTGPGIRRRRAGKSFSYVSPDGTRVKDPKILARIRALAIPPAYTDVWICPSANGHIQATGRDARGRKQYRYHADWRKVRDETKFDRLAAFAEALPKIRARIDRDLRRQGLPREKVLATVVSLLASTGIRIGNDEYAKANGSYGLTTLRDRHVKVAGATMRFSFQGKSGKQHQCDVTDPHLARIVRRCQAVPGEELFQYLDDEGQRQSIGSGDVNAYLRDVAGEDFTAKDFRTWNGTLLAIQELSATEAPASEQAARSNIVQVIDSVAKQLNNTRAVCRKYYIHPMVCEQYLAGTLAKALEGKSRNGKGKLRLSAQEQAALRLLTAAH